MVSKCLYFAILTVIFLLLQGATCFFVKHVKTDMCINVTGIVEASHNWGNLTFVGLSKKCLDPTVQNRFLNNSALLSLKTLSCFEGTARAGTGYKIPMLYLLRATDPKESCRNTDHAVIQTSWGGLSIYYVNNVGTHCAVPKKDNRIKNQGIDPFIGLEDCNGLENQRFNFGSVTCSGNAIKDANCPKDQYMVVKTASYRRLSPMKTCGLSDDYSCKVDVTCLLKKQCDGKRDCNITVNDNLFSGDQCPGSRKYLYFEYQCNDTATSFNNLCVDGASLSHSVLPNEGFVKITTVEGIRNVCWQSLEISAGDVVCLELGYKRAVSLVGKASPSDLKDAKSGNIVCNDGATKLAQCSVATSSQNCSNLSYLKCHICDKPLLEDRQQFPDSSFTASALSGSPPNARISSGSSWCAPVANGKHYLQVNFAKRYVIYTFVTFGDSTYPKWVTTYNLNYTVDRKNWKSVQAHAIPGNKDAYNDVVIHNFTKTITTTALRFIPLSFEGQPCTRIEICGATQFPDKPTSFAVTNIKTRSAEIFWTDPDNTGDGDIRQVWIKLKKENSLIRNITISNVNTYKLDSLKPSTTYEISIAVGNKHGFGEEIFTALTTSEDAPEGPPLNVTVTAESSSSLFVTWEPPKEDKRNGMIVNYNVCVSQGKNKPCFQFQTAMETMLVIKRLNALTKYYVRVLASTRVGSGPFSESKAKFTNAKKPEVSTNGTAYTLTFFLQIPQQNFTYFYVVVLKSKDGKKGRSPARYGNNELVTYTEAEQSTDPKPYIAAILTSKEKNLFILGDGRNTSIPTSRRRRSTSTDYYNGPLEPDSNYSIFQRIFINNMGDYYSTDWSLPSKTGKYLGGPRVLNEISSEDIKAKEGDLVNLLCSAESELPITFTWEKNKKSQESFMEKEKPNRSSLLVVKVKDKTSFGNYICHIRDRFQSTTHTISVQKYTEAEDDEKYLVGIIVLAILLVIAVAIIAYFTYRICRAKTPNAIDEKKRKDRNNLDIPGNPDDIQDDSNYEPVENVASTYTALKKTGNEENDDQLYAHLNEVYGDNEIEAETGM